MRVRKHLKEMYTLLEDIRDSVQQAEERELRHMGGGDLSPAEFHALECISQGEGQCRTVGEIAEALAVAAPTVTVCINKLEKKGYVTKTRCQRDARVIIVELTRKGRRMDRLHRYFHRRVLLSVEEGLTDGERELLLSCLRKLDRIAGENT